jgi:tRNA/tmRNA/rRNA uracil-C5-methylase (TrmA/RlmC/RlmD family)
MKGGLRPGEIVEVVVEKGVYRGLALARQAGQVVFVSHALPGERVRVRVERAASGYVNARLLEVLEPSADRRASPCPYFPRCGGCAYQHGSYEAQRRLKESVLRDALARAGVSWPAEIPVQASREDGWRTRAVFHLASLSGELKLGLFEEGSHRVVDVETCLQVSPRMNRTARALLEALRSRPAWAGAVRGIELAESGDGERLIACLQVQGEPRDGASLATLGAEVPSLGALGLTSEDRSYVPVFGDPHVETAVSGVVFRAHARSFFQGNRFLVEPLAQAVTAALGEGGTVLDLYSGVGLFSLLAARRAALVRSAEASAQAVADARFNLSRAGFPNVEIEASDVAAAVARWPVSAEEQVVLDPPRAGAGVKVVEAIVARQPSTVVYVSCDPPTLGRDLQSFLKHGYRLESLRAFDLFPDTFHIETLAVLKP